MAADTLGKHKTVWQIITASYFMVFLASQESAMAWIRPLFSTKWLGPRELGSVLIIMTLLTTLVSGWRYFWKNRELVLKEM